MKRFKGGLRRISAAGAKPENGAFADAIKRKYVSLRGQAQSSRPALVFRAVPTSGKGKRPTQAPVEYKRNFPAPSSLQPVGIPMRSEVRTIVKERVVERHTVVVREVERIVREQRVVREQAVAQPYTAVQQPPSDAGRRASGRKNTGGSLVGEQTGSRQPESGGRELLQRQTQTGGFKEQLRKEPERKEPERKDQELKQKERNDRQRKEQLRNDLQRRAEQERNEKELRQAEAGVREYRQQELRPEAGDPVHREQAPLPKSQTRGQRALQRPQGSVGAERGRQVSWPDRDRQERGPQGRRSDTGSQGQQHNTRQEASNSRDPELAERRDGKNVVVGQELSEGAAGLAHKSELEELPLPHSEQMAGNDLRTEAEFKERAQPQLAIDEAEELNAKADDDLRKDVRHSNAKQSEDKPSHLGSRENNPNSTVSENASANSNARQLERVGGTRSVSNADRVHAIFLQRPSRVNKGLSGIGGRTPVSLKRGIAMSAPAVRQLLARLSAGPAGTSFSAIRQLTLSSPGFVHAYVRRRRRGAIASNERAAALPQAERAIHSGKPASNEPKHSGEVRRQQAEVLHPPGFGSANSLERRHDSAVDLPKEPLRQQSAPQESGSRIHFPNSESKTSGPNEADASPVDNANDFKSRTSAGHDSGQAFGDADSGKRAQERLGSSGLFKPNENAEQKLPNSQRMSAAGRERGSPGTTDRKRLDERGLDGSGEDGQARHIGLAHEDREFGDRDPADSAASVKRGNESSNDLNRSLSETGNTAFGGDEHLESSSSKPAPLGDQLSIDGAHTQVNDGSISRMGLVTGLASDHAGPNGLSDAEQSFFWPFRLSLSARAVEREAVKREAATGREVLVHNVARRAFVSGAPSTALNRTYGSRWQSAWEAAPTIQIGEVAAESAKSDITNGQSTSRATNLTNAADSASPIVYENAEGRTSSNRLGGSIRARRHQGRGVNEERQPEAAALRSSALSPLVLPQVTAGASFPLEENGVAVQQSNGQPRLQSARLRGLKTNRSDEGVRLESAPKLILKRNDRLGLPSEGRTSEIKRVGRQDRINASNGRGTINGRTAAVRDSGGGGTRQSEDQGSLSRSTHVRVGGGITADAPRLVVKLGAVRSLSSGGTGETKAAAGRFAAGVTPSGPADFLNAAAGKSRKRDGAARLSPMRIVTQWSNYRGGQPEPVNRLINRVIENRKRMTNAGNFTVGLRDALLISSALTPRKSYAYQDAAGRTMISIHRPQKPDGPATSGVGTRSSDPSRSGREESAASAPMARLTLRDPLSQIAEPLRVEVVSLGMRTPSPTSPSGAANASTEVSSVVHPKTRTIGEDLAGLANAPINVVTNSQLDQFARGNERHPAAGPATDAMPSQGTARPKIVFGGTKTRPFQRLKLSREAKVFSAGRDGAITYRTNNARIASNASASQRLAQNRSTPSASSARLPYETESSIAEPKNAGWTTQSQAVQQDAHAAERLRPVNPVALTARTTRRAAVLSGASTPAVKAISPSDGQRAAGRQLINARQPSAARMPASVRSAGLPARIAPAGVTAVQLRRAAPRAAPPPDLAAFPAAAQSAARAHSPIAAASAASANPDAAQQHRAASRTAAAATETALAPAAATLQRSARQASAPSAQPRPAPAAELRLRRSQQAGSPAAPPLAAPSAELELRRTPKAAAPAQPQPMQPIAQEPPRLSTEQLQQAVREMPELDPERLADTVYTALMRRMKFEQRLSGY